MLLSEFLAVFLVNMAGTVCVFDLKRVVVQQVRRCSCWCHNSVFLMDVWGLCAPIPVMRDCHKCVSVTSFCLSEEDAHMWKEREREREKRWEHWQLE